MTKNKTKSRTVNLLWIMVLVYNILAVLASMMRCETVLETRAFSDVSEDMYSRSYLQYCLPCAAVNCLFMLFRSRILNILGCLHEATAFAYAVAFFSAAALAESIVLTVQNFKDIRNDKRKIITEDSV